MMVLRENGAPLSPSRILWHMRSINCHMGDGSQEDAHEFLRSFKIKAYSCVCVCIQFFVITISIPEIFVDSILSLHLFNLVCQMCLLNTFTRVGDLVS
jgi:hypothetical protein